MVTTYKTYSDAVKDFSDRMFNLTYGGPTEDRAWTNLNFAMRHYTMGKKMHPDSLIADVFREFVKKTQAHEKRMASVH